MKKSLTTLVHRSTSVPMNAAARSTPLKLLDDEEFSQRFCYWHGASGRRYIHSVYKADDCPALPGAIYIVVRVRETLRSPIDVFLMSTPEDLPDLDELLPGDEVHIHMLADAPEKAGSIITDLQESLLGYVRINAGLAPLRPKPVPRAPKPSRFKLPKLPSSTGSCQLALL